MLLLWRLKLLLLRLLLLLLLLELLLELLRNGGHRGSAGLERLLRRRLAETRELGLELPAESLLLRHTGRLRLHAGEPGILLLQRRLTEAGRLGSKRTGLLLLRLLTGS